MELKLKIITMKIILSKKTISKNMDLLKKNIFRFWRRGIVGAFKDELTLEQIKMIDDWCIKYLEKVGFSSEEELYATV